MELILASHKADKTIVNVEGGAYYTWSSSHFPVLSQKKLAAGLLVLQPRGFALPHYADSNKIAYVCQGECIAGIISPEDSKEVVLNIRKGDCLSVPLGVVSWWYNGGNSKVTIIFLGESDEYTPGEFNYFFLTGAMGILNGFSNEVINKSFHMTNTESEMLIKSQSNLPIIIKIHEGIKMPEPCNNVVKAKLVFNLDSGKSFTAGNSGNLSLFENIGLSAYHVKLEGGSLLGPTFTANSSVQLSYVTKGSGRIQIVGPNGKMVWDTKVQEGHLFFVPKFFPFAVEAYDDEGIEFLSVVTSSKQVFGQLAGNKSIWEALSPQVKQPL